MAVGIKEIARACGVSVGTVDRALNNRPGIKNETKDRILATAKKLNYHPNHLARCLATGCTKTIGVVCLDICDSFFSSLINVIEEVARQNGYFTTLIITRSDVDTELEGIRYLAERKVDGLILFPIAKGADYERMLKKLDIPVVTIYNRISDNFSHVDVDCRHIMAEAVSFICEKGYKHIAYVDVNNMYMDVKKNVYSFKQRRAGYLDAVKKYDLDDKIFDCCDEEGIINYICDTSGKKALLCAYDTIAIRILNTGRLHGIKVPEDVGIMGFNNIEMLGNIFPRIYSVDCNISEIGKSAFYELHNLIKGSEPKGDIVIPYRISKGESL